MEPVTLIPIAFVELKVKQENKTYSTLKTLLDSGASSTLITAKAVQHLKKHMQENQFQLRGRNFFFQRYMQCEFQNGQIQPNGNN